MIFGPAPRKKRSKRAILNALNRKLAKRERIKKKKAEAVRLNNAIEAARKKIRGY